MSIGFGVFLMALGAILSFAVSDRVPGVNLAVVGYICMAAGLVTLILSIILMNQSRRRTTVVEREHIVPPTDPYGRR